MKCACGNRIYRLRSMFTSWGGVFFRIYRCPKCRELYYKLDDPEIRRLMPNTVPKYIRIRNKAGEIQTILWLNEEGFIEKEEAFNE